MHRLLIVGTVPYNNQSPSRAFESYFHGWEEDCIAQVFSNPREPIKGHCGTLFQITDQQMLFRWFHHDFNTGIVYRREDLPERFEESKEEISNQTIKRFKRYGAIKKSSFSHLARKVLWRKKYWCTTKLNAWLDDFSPECLFLAFSDDYFILEMALYIAERYSIPIISCIGDDYFFNSKFSLSPLYHLYKYTYRHLVRKVFLHGGTAAYIGDKIKEKYNKKFNLNGETVFLSSSIQRRPFRPINSNAPKIRYFGNLFLGRNESLLDVADALREINQDYHIDVYSNDTDPLAWEMLSKHPNIAFYGSIPYSTVKEETAKSDVLLVVEGFKRKDVNMSRYSLSTKVADSLASGVSVFGYGSYECGAIEYLKSLNCAPVCVNKTELVNTLKKLLFDPEIQEKNYYKALDVVEHNHRLEKSTQVFRSLVEKVVANNG